MWVTRVSSSAAIASIMASYAGFFWAPAATGAGRGVLIALVMGALTWINLAGIRQAAGVAGMFAVAKIVPLLMFVLVGAFFFDPTALATWTAPALPAFSQTMLLLIFAFVGFETTTVAAGEAHDPRRDIPFALFAGIGAAVVLYLLIQLVCIGTLPDLAGSERPLADAGARMAGVLGGAIISLGALISTTGALHATVITGPRMLYAMGLREQLPPVFARTLARHHTPHVAILATSAAGLALALSGTFVYLATLSVIARLTAYVATALALLVFRHRAGVPPAAFRLRAAGLVVTLACASCAWLVTTSAARELRDVAIATAAGFVLYAVTAAARRAGSASRG
jgi:amino acid transporter